MHSVRNRLALLIFVITAAAVGFIYLYVVPQLRSSLTAEKLRRLEQVAADQSGQLGDAMRADLSEGRLAGIVRGIDQRTGAHVTVLGVRQGAGGPEPTFVIADSERERSAVAPTYPAASAAIAAGPIASAVERLGGVREGETAVVLSEGETARWIAVFVRISPTSRTTSR